jgi:hypothetical protein
MNFQMTFQGMESVPHNRTPTSISAAKRVKANPEHRESDEERVMAFIENRGDVGATDGEIQAGLNLPGDTERPRRYGLYHASRIKAAGTRKNKNGLSVTVWVKA